MSKSLFISYDGMTDPLGQSQVIPYLAGLVRKGHKVVLLSCEKPEVFEKHRNTIQQLLDASSIEWHPIKYHKSPPVVSTWWDIRTLKKTTERLHKKHQFDILHCRSYISAMVGIHMQKKHGTKFLFDMRGFWADERVDGKLWNLNSPLYSRIYKYFKRKETEYLSKADFTISLTHNAAKEIHSWNHVQNQPVPIQVIPCCVDLDHFHPDKVKDQQEFKRKLGIQNEFIISYIGSIGTWYMLDEMLDFFKVLKKKKEKSKFLFITKEPKEMVLQAARQKNINPDDLIVTPSERADVPTYISLSNLSIFFIKPAFSKKASSPTKQGEIMAMNIPIVCNSNVGDTSFVVEKYDSGIVINNFNDQSYEKALEILEQPKDYNHLRDGAKDFYSLEQGVNLYHEVYEKLTSSN